jgi:tRNA(Ile)-lysidine synthase
MIADVTYILKDSCQLDPDRPILVGVSGGPDSVCLSHILLQNRYALIIAHFNHGLRPEAADEAEFVRQLAIDWQIAFILGQEDVAAFASEQGYSLEEGARLARYRFLSQKAAEYGAQAIAVAHTADDQVETVLMHFLRGAGAPGLRGMAFRTRMKFWGQDIPLVRPLLSTWREDILDYLEAHQLPSRFDQSNLDVRFYRNRLRHELIPYLKGYQPAIRQNLWRMAEILRAEDEALEEMVLIAWAECLRGKGKGYVILNQNVVSAQNTAIQRRLVRKSISLLRPGLRDIDFKATERALAFVESPTTSKQILLGAGLSMTFEDGAIWLTSREADLPNMNWPQIPPGETFQLTLPGTLALPGGWILRGEIITKQEIGAPFDDDSWPAAGADPYQAWMDADRIQTPLLVRARHPGDRFHPLGLEAHSLKLADFMINVKLPQRARKGWPLVISGDTIAWVPGMRLAHPFRITPQTRQQIHLSLERVGATFLQGDSV